MPASADQMQRAARAGAQAINAGRFAAPGVPQLLCDLADVVEELRTELAATRVERDAAQAEVQRLKVAIKAAEADVWRETPR
jgi:hypothetical protein